MASIIQKEFLKMKLGKCTKNYDPELKMNMPLRHNFDSDNKIMQKNVLYVKTLA